MAGVSQAAVARVERGDLRGIAFGTLERVTAALGITVRLDGRWHGGDGDRLIDREHAAVVEAVVAELRRMGWDVLLEFTFNHFGERGSVDVVGWHARSGALVIVEGPRRPLKVPRQSPGDWARSAGVGRALPRWLVVTWCMDVMQDRPNAS